MSVIVRATDNIEWQEFFLEKGRRILLDTVHLYGEVFLPESGMVNIPYLRWIDQGLLVREGTMPEMQTFATPINSVVEPMFAAILQHIPPGRKLVGVELGVHLGVNAERILKHVPMHMLYLVDPYDHNPDFQPGNPDLARAKQGARERLRPYENQTRIVWIYERSVDALPFLHNLDFAYHDSDHRRKCVEEELPLGYAAVRTGGWWGGHDYRQTMTGHAEVKSCVDEFVIDHSLSPLWYCPSMLNWWLRK